MSIFSSLAAPSDDQHSDECAIWDKRVDADGETWEISDRPCDCGQPDAPLVYQGSHVLPAVGDPRGGDVDLALIPGHITRDERDDGDGTVPWPYLRLGVNGETVILTRRHVSMILTELSGWLEHSVAHPECAAGASLTTQGRLGA